ncbi:hypothetical protein EGK14_12575 [Erwinia sp. 198]|nr:hypothetical protein EGK14_12575 [Erwinia sp. 198]
MLAGEDLTPIPAVRLAAHHNPMRFSDGSGGVSRRRVTLPFGRDTGKRVRPAAAGKYANRSSIPL